MEVVKNSFLVVMFFILVPTVFADEIRVLYFYNTPCVFSKEMEPYKNEIKDWWEGKIDWIEYNHAQEENEVFFQIYKIFDIPVAVVECFNKSYRIERTEILTKLNRTIYECYSECGNIMVERKECDPPEYVEYRDCGNCGNQTRMCKIDCQWEEWSDCINQGVCSVGESQNESCTAFDGCSGIRTRACNSTCHWGEWGDCIKIDPNCTATITIVVDVEEDHLKYLAVIVALSLLLVLMILKRIS